MKRSKRRGTVKNQVSQDKWGKFKVLKGSKKLVPFLPATRRMTKQAFWEFIGKYGTVILKPCVGHSGHGVIQVCSKENGQYEIHAEYINVTFEEKERMYSILKKGIRSRNYIVQRRIPLAKINERPFDLRVMIQRKKDSTWKVTGMVAKVAHKGYVITNVTTTILPIKKAIQESSIKIDYQQELLSNIHDVSLQAAKRLGDVYPFQRTIGLDIGLDEKGKIWIIEANFKPGISPFLMLKNKTMYRRIMTYKKA